MWKPHIPLAMTGMSETGGSRVRDTQRTFITGDLLGLAILQKAEHGETPVT